MATAETNARISEILAKMDAQGINFDTEMENPLSSDRNDRGYGCVIEKPFGINVVVLSTFDEYADLSYLDESEYAEDREMKEHVESYVIWVIIRDGDKVLNWNTLCGVDIDGRESNRSNRAYLGEAAMDLMLETQDEIDAAVKAAGERIARYI